MAALETLVGTDEFDSVESKLNAAIDALNALSSTNSIGISVLDIGDWDMDATASVSIPHGKSFSNVLCAFAWITNDDGTTKRSLTTIIDVGTWDEAPNGWLSISGSDIVLNRLGGGLFDSTSYNQTSYNRGTVLFVYLK